MSFLRRLDRLLSKVELFFLVAFLGAMVLLAFAQVVLRNVFGTGFIWADTIVRHLVLWAGFTGAALATSEERHIAIDALTRFLSSRVTHFVHALTSLFGIVVCYFLADASMTFLADEQAAGGELVLSIQSWMAMLIIPIGYALMCIHFAVRLIEHIATGFRPREAP